MVGSSAKNAVVLISAPSVAPLDQAIDLDHLARMTLGERGLECEVLALFDRQAGMLIARMRDAAPGTVAASAHTLKGSAQGVGAWRVARAAEAVELAASASGPDLNTVLDQLDGAVIEVRGAIAELLRAH